MNIKGNLIEFAQCQFASGSWWVALVESVVKHGGNAETLNALLADATEPKIHLDKFVQGLMGEIWRLVQEPVDLNLNSDHFSCSIDEFVELYPNIQIAKSTFFGPNSESVPHGRCKYRLHHFGSTIPESEVMAAFLQANIEPAGWRELAAYISKLELAKLNNGYLIIAFDSDFLIQAMTTDNLAMTFFHRKKIQFDQRDFFLVREYE